MVVYKMSPIKKYEDISCLQKSLEFTEKGYSMWIIASETGFHVPIISYNK